MSKTTFLEELTDLINRHGAEAGSNTPDYILADYLNHSLAVFNGAVKERSRWYGHEVRETAVLSCEATPFLKNLSKLHEFETLAHPLIKWLNDNYHPHVTAIITPTSAEVLEGSISTGQILDYVRD